MINIHVAVIRSSDNKRIAELEAVDMNEVNAWIASESAKWGPVGSYRTVIDDMTTALAEQNRKEQVVANRRARALALARKIKDGTITAAERNEALGLLLLDFVKELD